MHPLIHHLVTVSLTLVNAAIREQVPALASIGER
jgi:hypothetical protein